MENYPIPEFFFKAAQLLRSAAFYVPLLLLSCVIPFLKIVKSRQTKTVLFVVFQFCSFLPAQPFETEFSVLFDFSITLYVYTAACHARFSARQLIYGAFISTFLSPVPPTRKRLVNDAHSRLLRRPPNIALHSMGYHGFSVQSQVKGGLRDFRLTHF